MEYFCQIIPTELRAHFSVYVQILKKILKLPKITRLIRQNFVKGEQFDQVPHCLPLRLHR